MKKKIIKSRRQEYKNSCKNIAKLLSFQFKWRLFVFIMFKCQALKLKIGLFYFSIYLQGVQEVSDKPKGFF